MDGIAEVKSVNIGGRKYHVDPTPIPRNLRVDLPNNQFVEAPIEVWIGAIMTVLSDKQKHDMVEMVTKMR